MLKELVLSSNSTLNLYIFNFHQWVAAFFTWAETRFLNAKGSRRVYRVVQKKSYKL